MTDPNQTNVIAFCSSSGNPIPFAAPRFSGGEMHVQLIDPKNTPSQVMIIAHLRTSDDVMLLLLLNDTLRRQRGVSTVECLVPYLPYARQDRVTTPGTPFSSRVFADLLNGCGFNRVVVVDPHSAAAISHINNVVVLEQHTLVRQCVAIHPATNLVVVAPDLGAAKKAEVVAQAMGTTRVGFLTKQRDPVTGHLSNARLLNPEVLWSGEPNTTLTVLIVDDICDGGATFMNAAAELRKAADGPVDLQLYVTHGIFSRGVDGLLGPEGYSLIYTPNPWPGITHPRLIASEITALIPFINQLTD